MLFGMKPSGLNPEGKILLLFLKSSTLFPSASDSGVWEGRAACQGMRRVVLGLSIRLLNHLGHYETVTALIAFVREQSSSKYQFQCLFTLMTWVSQSVS